MSESQLIVRAQQGNKDAFSDLMEIHYRTVEKFAYQCGVHLDDIPDVTQEVFIKIYRFLHQFNHERFTTWLYKITLNTARDYYRKESRERGKERKAFANHEYFTPNSVEAKILIFEEDYELHIAILKLDEKYRIPLILYYFQDLSYQQIAEIMNISLSAVKTRMFRAKDGLKNAINADGGVLNEK
ncbi:RNA polymerase sigma factor [Sporosarcina sp. FA9]|uniref:RNA polymerase sigma factor n=1 Tax=Sporosarcina sp. FA9 TaxID=3413030 RepID=UPI003F655D69